MTACDTTTKILLCPRAVASGNLVVRLVIISFSRLRGTTFQEDLRNRVSADENGLTQTLLPIRRLDPRNRLLFAVNEPEARELRNERLKTLIV